MSSLRKKNLLLVLMLMLSASLYSQQFLVDSMEKHLQGKLPDSSRLLGMVRLAMYYEPVDADKAHRKYAEARQEADQLNMPFYKGLSYRYESTLYSFHEQYDRVLSNLEQAVAIFQGLQERKALRELGNSYTDLGNYYAARNNETKAIEYDFKAAELLEKNGFKLDLITAYLNLSGHYKRLGQLEEQKVYAQKALVLSRELNRPKSLFMAFTFLANYYSASQQYPPALVLLDSARKYFSDRWDMNMQENYFMIRASTFQGLKQFDSAKVYFQTSYDYAVKNNLGWYQVQPLLKLGYIHLLEKKYAPAEKYLNQALEASLKDSSILFQKEAYESLARLYSETNRYKDAYYTYKTFHALTDSLVGTEKKKYSLELQTKYETAKKEQVIQSLQDEKKIQALELRQKNTLNYLLLGGGAILLLLGGLLTRNYRQKQALQQQLITELEKERQLTATEAVLRGEEQERARLARDLHDGLSGMLSGAKYSLQTMKGNLVMTPDNQQSFERGMDMLDSSILEMRRVAQNMMPEALIRFGLDTALKDYCTEINKNGIIKAEYQSMGLENLSLPQGTSIAIYRIVQELTNNVIKHAGASQVLVQLLAEESKLLINVEDDGRGFDKLLIEKSLGMGWKNIQSRIEYLKGKTDIRTSPGKGTSINIELNLRS